MKAGKTIPLIFALAKDTISIMKGVGQKMTIFDKIEVKIVQFVTLSTYILLSRKWFAWLLKLPVFVLFVCALVITRPYEWLYAWATTRHATEADAFFERAMWLQEKACTEKFEDLIMIFY